MNIDTPALAGDRVAVRDRIWRVRRKQPVADGVELLDLEALDGEAPPSLSVVSPPDVISPLPPEEVRFDLATLVPWGEWANAHRFVEATSVRESSSFSGALFGRVTVEAYRTLADGT